MGPHSGLRGTLHPAQERFFREEEERPTQEEEEEEERPTQEACARRGWETTIAYLPC